MQALRSLPQSRQHDIPEWSQARIVASLDEDLYLLDDGRPARRAVSCVVAPLAGDEVLVARAGGKDWLVHILARPERGEALLGVPGARSLALRNERLELAASAEVAIRSLRDLELTAATGTLALSARNLFAAATESWVQSARHYVGRVGEFLLETKNLLRLHGRQAQITAEKDVKIDAERISVG